MILPIEKYKLLNQAYLARRRCCQILRRFFSLQEKGITVKLSMGIIKSNPKLPLRGTYDAFDSKRMSKYIRKKSKIKFTTRLIYCCGFQFQVLCQKFLNATNSKDRPTVDGKNSAKCRANFLAEH